MSRQILQDIVENFRVEDFTRFFRSKNDKFSHPNELLHYGDENFTDGKKLEEAKLDDGNLLVCSFLVKKFLSERFGKKAQYELGKKVLKESQADAGIFIFYDKSGNFRFSLVYTNYLGKRRDWSTFRRFTYFVSKEFTNKTFFSVIGDGDFSSLEKIKKSFSVEKVTKEFYLEYRKLFENLVSELPKNHTFLNEAAKNGLDAENFTKKLLGQIVFLYFIQKKGWLAVAESGKWGDGDKNFISNLFKKAEKNNQNFFNDYLEKLFYNALNNPRRDSADPSFSEDFNCRIPFLNGGLFEAGYNWKNSFISLDNKIFQAIFEVFDRYNFTVEEENPNDKEIAVDPEMLGKVFENLLPENLRKGKGTYYTPREIVYYMCRESLVNYLILNHSNITEEEVRNYIFYSESFENFKKQKGQCFTPRQWKELDDLLKNIKVCDPACGSGAFLVGMLNLIVKLRLYLQTTPDSHLIPQKTEYELKKEAIQNCIYGVDIDPGAIEIAKLRLWLSLVVDYKVEDIEPLPNLDYRLMCGNSLLEEYEGVKFYNSEGNGQQATLLIDTGKQEKIAELKKKVKEYFDIHDDKEKQVKRKEINDIKDWLVRSALEKRKKDLTTQRKNEEAKANMLDQKSREKYLASWGDKFLAEAKIKEVLDNLHNPKAAKPFFIWKLEFIDVFEDKKGFDIVIANPPYVSYGLRGGQEMSSNEKELLKRIFPNSAEYKISLYALFMDRAIQIAQPNSGQQIFIVPDSFLLGRYFSKIRRYILQTDEIKSILLLPYNVFDATIGFSVVYCFQKKAELSHNNLISARLAENNEQINSGDFKYFNYQQSYFEKTKYNRFRLFFDEKTMNLVSKIENGSSELVEFMTGRTGVRSLIGQKKIISKEKKSETWQPGLISGSQITKYKVNHEGDFINIDPKKLNKGGWDYDVIHNPKLLLRQTGDSLTAAIDYKGYYHLNNIHSFAPNNKRLDILYLLALINSRLLDRYYKIISLEADRVMAQTDIETIESLPIKEISEKEQKPFIKIVDEILRITLKSGYDPKNHSKEQKDLEEQIDKMIYKLYDLTPEEIKIIEANN